MGVMRAARLVTIVAVFLAGVLPPFMRQLEEFFATV
jgi:hypothetical protein